MVSLRRRRLLGLCCGAKSSSPGGENVPDNAACSSNPFSVHPMLMEDAKMPAEVNGSMGGIESSNLSASNEYKEQNSQPNDSGSNSSKEQNHQPTAERQSKRRKPQRRRLINNQEQCGMTGVYFKNMKWQAAIKVDRKQIHLGTLSSAEEAAHLYDRAAFMCGRQPNFELPEEEKRELSKLKWDEFLAIARHAITTKKTKKLQGGQNSTQNSDWERDQGTEGLSASDGV